MGKRQIPFAVGFLIEADPDECPKTLQRLRETCVRLDGLMKRNFTYDKHHLVDLLWIMGQVESLMRRARAAKVRTKRKPAPPKEGEGHGS